MIHDANDIILRVQRGELSEQEAIKQIAALHVAIKENGAKKPFTSPDAAIRYEDFFGAVQLLVATTLRVEPQIVAADEPLSHYGFNSILLTEFSQKLLAQYPNIRLQATTFMQHGSLGALCRHLYTAYFDSGSANTKAPAQELPPRLTPQPESAPHPSAQTQTWEDQDIAIIGIGGRFPGAQNIPEFWSNLLNEKPLIKKIPKERWSWQDYFGDVKEANKTDCCHGAFIDDVDQFDPLHFHISPKEADLIDPQQRLLLQATWETLENAGYAKADWVDKKVGFFVAAERLDYLDLLKLHRYPADPQFNVGNAHSMLANRVSHFFGWKGPVAAVNAACAGSFSAIYSAMQSLRNGDADMALAGGINLVLAPDVLIYNRKLGLFTAEEQIRPFDKKASGHFFGDGVGLVCLRRMKDAVADNNHILGVIKGMSVRHGGGEASLFSPNPRSHCEIIEETLQKAGLRANDIDYLEAQGTANPIADQVELQAYHRVFSRSLEHGVLPDKLLLSSLKGHIGHLASASGVVSLIKCILSLNKNTLTRIGNFESLNWDDSDGAFACQTVSQTTHWPAKMANGARVARHIGIHNFGFGGVNGHMILEEYLDHQSAPRTRVQKPELIVLSARTLKQVKQFAQRLVNYVNKQEFSLFGIHELYLEDIAYTLLTGRELLNERVFFVAHSLPDLLEKLRHFIDSGEHDIPPNQAAHNADADLFNSIPLSQVESMLQQWVKDGELDRVGALWRSGFQMQWAAIHGLAGQRKRIPLPTYVFDTKSYWLTPAPQMVQMLQMPQAQQSARLAVTPPAACRQKADLSAVVLAELESLLGVPVHELQGKTSLSNFGLNSIQVLSLKSALESRLAYEFPLSYFQLSLSPGELVATLNQFIASGKPMEYGTPQLIHQPDLRFAPFPMTDLQQSYWLGRRSTRGIKVGSLVYYELRVPGADIDKLNTAWNEVVAAHEMLRCVISDDGRQNILEHVAPYHIEQFDYRTLAPTEQSKMRRQLRETLTQKIYDTKQFPLFTLCISTTKNETQEESLLHFSIDPIIADGASIKLLLRQWETLIRQPQQTLSAPTSSFRDYVLSIKDFQTSPRVQKDEAYWKRRLVDLPDGPQLLKAPESVAASNTAGTRLRQLLSEEVSSGLKRKAAELEVSVSTLVLCLFTNTLHHYSFNADFSLILTIFNRLRLNADVDQVVGPFTSTGLFAARHTQQVDFESFVRASHAQILSDLDHSYVSGIRAMELARQENRQQRWPNLNIAFTSLLSDLHQEKSPIEDAISYSLVQTPHISLEHQLSQTADQIDISWYVAKQSYPAELIEPLFRHYLEVIQHCALQSGTWPVAETVQHRSALGTRLTTASLHAPLTYLQQAYLFGRSPFGGAKASYIYACFDIQELDIALLQKTWNKLLSAHEQLRTVFEKNGTQSVLEQIPEYLIQSTDLRTLAPAQAQAACDDIARTICEASTDLGAWPYFDLRVTRRADATSRLHCKIDLLVADGACIEYLPELLFYHYQHPELEVKAPACTYRDYAASLRAFEHTESETRCLSYWETKLSSIPAGPDFSFAKTKETKQTKRFSRRLNNWGSIKQLAQQMDVAPAMILLTAFMDLIAGSVDQQEFSVAIPTWQRQPVHPDIYQVIGDFTSLSWISHQPSNRSFAQRVLENAAAFKSDMQHSLVNGLRGLGKLKRTNTEKRFPLVFSDLSPLKLPGHPEKFKRVDGLSYTSQVEWDHICFETGDELELCWDINAGLFSNELINQMFDRYHQVLASLPEHHEDLPDFSDTRAASPQSQIEQWNSTAVPYARATCIHQLFEASALKYPHRIAVTDRVQAYSYETLDRKANQLAWKLKKCGVGPEVYVGICLPRTVDLLVGLLAILKAGGAYVPLELSDPSARLFRVIETAGIGHVLVDEGTAAIFSASGLSLISLSDPGISLESESKPVDTVKSHQAAYAIFTSGSTGQPKGVAVEHRPVINLIEWAKREFHFDEQDVALFITRLSFDLSVFDVFGMLAYGAKIIIVGDDQRENPQQISTLLCTRDVTFWNSAPGTLNILLPFLKKERTDSGSPSSLRLLFLSGDWIPLTLPGDIRMLFPKAQFISLGGATEATVWSNYYPVTDINPLWRSIPYGRPIQNARYYILDQQLQHCPIGDEGDLYIGGECLSRGYLNAPAITATSFVPDPYSSAANAVMYRTGDSARFYADGNIEFLGRKDHQVKVRGFRIELGEIEFHFLQHAHIAEAVALVRETRPGDQKIVAYLALKPGSEIAIKDLRAYLQARLPHYMLPNIFVTVADIPITANGKFDRTALPWPVVSPEDGLLRHQQKHKSGSPNAETGEASVMTTNSVIETIEAIFLTALDCASLRPDDDLFDRGATSFTLVQAVERIQDKYRIAIPFDVLLATPTVQAIAGYVAAEVVLQHGSTDLLGANSARPANLPIQLPTDDFHDSHYQGVSEAGYATLIPLKNLGELLSLIKPVRVENKSKYLYSSAGGLTPIQVYVWVKENAVENLAQGVYYYHPDEGQLVLIDGSAQIKTASFYYHDQALYDASGFAIFMIAEMDAIAPLYGRSSEQMVILEAGYIGQLLQSTQHQHQVALRPLGGLDFDRMSCLFKLKPSQRFVHCILGGHATRMQQNQQLSQQLSERKNEYHRKNALASEKLHCISSADASDIQLPRQEEAQRIHQARAHLRAIAGDQNIIALPAVPQQPQLQQLYSAKRNFQTEAISQKTLGLVLSLFRARSIQNEARYLYPSIDGEYGVNIHVLIQPAGVQGLAAGVYRYERESHQLVLISPTLSAEFKSCFTPFNRTHAQASQFAIFLSQKKHRAYFSLLESGYMGQLLLERQAELGIGACPIGGMMFEKLSADFGFADDDMLMHSFLCGSHQMPIPDAYQTLNSGRAQPQQPAFAAGRSDDIAIVGLSGRYPGARTPQEFARNLSRGEKSFSDKQFSHATTYRSAKEAVNAHQHAHSHHGGFLDHIDQFDSLLFKIAPSEARSLDPQVRLLLETVWECLESAGYTAHALNQGSKDVGVFVGAMWNDYQYYAASHWEDTRADPVSHPSMANRISYFFDFQGPSISLDTSCCSAMTALHFACSSIKNGECAAAIVGGVNLMSHPYHQSHLDQLDLLSKDGHCYPFGKNAAGWIVGEGVGAVLLKPLAQAMQDHDFVLGVIKGSAISHGGKTSRFGAPNPDNQRRSIEQVIKNSSIDMADISYVEAAAPGASLADASEVTALKRVFGDRASPLYMGSVKANIGHLESASALSQLTKVLMQMQYGQLFPSLDCEPVNPMLQLNNGALSINSQLRPWETPRKIALINAFGAAGSAGHAVIASHENQIRPTPDVPALVKLSAQSQTQLSSLVEKLHTYLKRPPPIQIRLKDIAYTLQVGRVDMPERVAIIAHSLADLCEKLEQLMRGAIGQAGVFRTGCPSTQTTEPLALAACTWVNGNAVDWPALHSGDEMRIPLPTYSFAADVHWVSERAIPANPARPLQTSAPQEQTIVSNSLVKDTERYLKMIYAQVSEIPAEKISANETFDNYGITSLMVTKLNTVLEQHFSGLSKTLFFEYQTLAELAAYLATDHPLSLASLFGSPGSPGGDSAPPPAMNAGTESSPRQTGEIGDIAIVGLAGRYPGANTLDQFWRNLMEGKDSITEIPKERWDNKLYFQANTKPAEIGAGKYYNKWGGFIEHVDSFDPLFFNISPKEAAILDPQERLFLEVAWECLEDAGYDRAALKRAFDKRVGVFVGVTYGDYQLFSTPFDDQGNGRAVRSCYGAIANRVSYLLDCQGPSMAVDTLCSSSLTALHLAIQSLQTGESKAALVGGINLSIHPNKYILQSQINMNSTDGRCRSFGDGGDGFVPGEGVSACMLRPLKDAIADGDNIYGVIKASVINNDGKTHGFTVPNPKAQGKLIAEALRIARLSARAVSYVEAHGTGTSLGDPIEIAGLCEAFRQHTQDTGYCAIGSVKSNIGHLEAAAGLAGLTKILLQMKHGQLVPSLHSRQLNQNIHFEQTPFYVQQSLQPWSRHQQSPRIACLSSFGAGGSNAHVIVEEYRASVAEISACDEPELYPVLLSARTRPQLLACCQRLLSKLQQETQESQAAPALRDVAFTLQVGREAKEHRLAMMVASLDVLKDHLQQIVDSGQFPDSVFYGQVKLNQETADDGGMPGQKTAADLVQGWLQGASINWGALYGKNTAKRISLPSYPFSRESYWIGRDRKLIPSTVTATAETTNTAKTSDINQWMIIHEKTVSAPFPEGISWRDSFHAQSGKNIAIVHCLGEEERAIALSDLIRKIEQSVDAKDSIPIQLLSCDRDAKLDFSAIPDVVFVLTGTKDKSARDESALYPVFKTSQTLMKQAYDRRLSLYLIEESSSPRGGALSGFLGAAMMENPQHIWTIIENKEAPRLDSLQLALREWLAYPAHALNQATHKARRQRGKIFQTAAFSQVVYENAERKIKQKIPLLFDAASKSADAHSVSPATHFRKGGTYLIAGGSGLIGQDFCKSIARQFNANIIILSRRQNDDAIAVFAQEIAQLGGNLSYYSVDISDLKALGATYDLIKSQHPRVNGILNLAGSSDATLILRKTWEDSLAHLQAKVHGTENLDTVSADEDLDFFLLFSSIGAYGLAGASAYAYACAFQNEFVRYRDDLQKLKLRRGKTLALAWGPWTSDPIHARADSKRTEKIHADGFSLIDIDLAFPAIEMSLRHTNAVLGLVYAHHFDQVCALLQLEFPEDLQLSGKHAPVAGNDFSGQLKSWESQKAQGRAFSFDDLAGTLSLDQLRALDPSSIERIYQLLELESQLESPPAPARPNTAPEQASLVDSIREVLTSVLELSELDNDEHFETYGLDSISGTQVSMRLEKRYKHEIKPEWLVQYPTVKSLSDYLKKHLLTIYES